MLKSCIEGHWVEPLSGRTRVDLVNPATEQIIAEKVINGFYRA